MSFVLLRRQVIPNPTGVGAPFSATNDYWNGTLRKPYSTQEDSQVNDPFELAKDTEVDRYDYAVGKTRLIFYNGNGSIYTKNLVQPSTGIGTPLALKLLPGAIATTDVNASDAYLDLTGQFGVPPYQLEVTGQLGQATGYYQTAVSQLEIYPVRFYNLANGEYFLKVTDATGDFRTQLVTVQVAQYGYPMGTRLRDNFVNGRLIRAWWRGNELSTFVSSYNASQGNGDYQIPYGTLIDAYLLPGSNGTTWRQVYAGYQNYEVGSGEVYFVDSGTEASSSLSLHNLILFNPDTTTAQNGGALVEVQGGTPPLRYAFTTPTGPVVNATGRLDGRGAGAYEVRVSDALGGALVVPFKLADRYRLWKYLNYDNLDGVPLRAELWRRDFDGEATAIFGTDQPVVIKSDGLSGSLGGQGDLPSAVGRSAELNFLAEIDLFESVIIGDDRNCRCDFYYDGTLDFRGYVKPDIYTAPLLDGLQPTSLVATDGLADLKDTDMLGHVGQRLGGHWPVLNTLLHCLSRTEVALPVRIFTNRRDSAMATADAPELVATTNRTGYYDDEKDTPADQRTVVDALAQLLGGTLVQRQGAWEVRSALEAAVSTPGREYRAAGTPVGEVVALAPSGAILPPGPTRWHWLEASQNKQVRPGWKSLVGTTNAGWLKNAFWQGDVFSDPSAWLEGYGKLRGVLGWREAALSPPFPLVLQRVGEKGKDYSTLWPRSLNGATQDARYLISPPVPLAAGAEGVPAFINITGTFAPTDYYRDEDGVLQQAPTAAKQAFLSFELLVDGHATGAQLAVFDLSADGKPATFTLPLPLVPSGATAVVLRLRTWTAADTNQLRDATDIQSTSAQTFLKGRLVKDVINGVPRLFFSRRDFVTFPLTDAYNWVELTASDASTGQLLISSVGIELRPQSATWDGEDSFRADGPGGSVRPTEPLKVYHPDVPLAAGLFAGNLFAFGKGVGLVDGTQTTSWSRAVDLDASPLFEANVFDQQALRAAPSRLLVGTVRHKLTPPPYLLDSVDAPFDTPGRRFLVGSATWDTKAAEVEVSLIEIGKSDDADIAWPDGARITNRVYPFAPGRYVPYLRVVRGGIRVRRG